MPLAVSVNFLGSFEVPDGAADIVEQTESVGVWVARACQGGVHSALSESHATGNLSMTLSAENLIFLIDVSNH